MALLDDVKVALRLSSDAMDSEVQTCIDAAVRDMRRVGIPEAMLSDEALSGDSPDPLVKMAVTLYAKAHFGYDNDEASRFMESYRQTVIDMRNGNALYGGSE